jgi:hypothetical protein
MVFNYFFHVVLICTELGQDLPHTAQKENMRSEKFSLRQVKNVNYILFS